MIVDLLKTINRNRHTEVFCNPERPCITLPGPKQTRRYEFMLRSGENIDHATSELNVRTLMDSVGPDKNQRIKRIRSYTFHARVAKTWRYQRVFLAGDSAHLSPPFAGQLPGLRSISSALSEPGCTSSPHGASTRPGCP